MILSNPPFAGTIPKDSMRTDLPTNSKKSELLFLSVMMQSLAPGGTCAVVVPEGLLFGSTKAHKALREKLLRSLQCAGQVARSHFALHLLKALERVALRLLAQRIGVDELVGEAFRHGGHLLVHLRHHLLKKE